MKAEFNKLIDRCYNIKNDFLRSVFTFYGGFAELHTIMFYLLHGQILYYHGKRINQTFLNGLNQYDKDLLLDIYKFYEK